ncbi:MAG TPA: choice-of-anchor J domain-containing protein [Flavipsychrobacter sp.]|nr:choice-of-anchor J domain-containing protein [Flavipsychrobacter sp.]
MKKIALLFASGTIAGVAMAQTPIPVTGTSLNYTQNFNTLDTVSVTPYNTNLPAGWGLAETGTNANTSYRGGMGTSNSGDTYAFFATTASGDRALGGLASGSLLPGFGAIFTNSTGSVITSFNISYKGEQWRLGQAASNVDTLTFMYSTNATSLNDAAATWMTVPAVSFTSVVTSGTAGAMDGNMNSANVNTSVVVTIPVSGTLYIKWTDPNIIGNDDALAIDDLNITFATGTPPPPGFKPVIVGLSPADNSSNVATSVNSLQVTFDRNITVGTGSIIVKNQTDQTHQTITLPSSNVTTSGKTATIANLTFVQGKTYHVTFDSAAFDTAGYKCSGIYDTSGWNFSTVQGVLTSLNETFDASCPAGLPLGWTKYSVVGPGQQWTCHSFGYNNTPAMSMNGYQNGNNDNQDWLITPQLDLSSMTNAYFAFRAFKKFAGDDIHVLVSNDYDGSHNPTDQTFSWTDLNVSFTGVDTNFNIFGGNITPFKATPMHVAFRYTSSTANGAQWKLDDVMISGTASLIQADKSVLQFAVLGDATPYELTLGCAFKAGRYDLGIYDLAGRNVYSQTLTIVGDTPRQVISGFNLSKGMYIIKIADGTASGASKLIIR